MITNFDEIETLLYENKNLKHAEFCKKLTPNSKTFLGVKMPMLRRIANKISPQIYIDFLDNFREEFEEDYLLKAIVLGKTNLSDELYLQKFSDFCKKVNDWSVCDTFCQSQKNISTRLRVVFDYLENLSKSSDEFSQRIVAVMMLTHYINDEYIDSCFSLLQSLNSGHYYTDMSVGWFIANAFDKYKQKTINFLKSGILTRAQCYLAVKKINESLKPSKEDKLAIKNLYKTYYE